MMARSGEVPSDLASQNYPLCYQFATAGQGDMRDAPG